MDVALARHSRTPIPAFPRKRGKELVSPLAPQPSFLRLPTNVAAIISEPRLQLRTMQYGDLDVVIAI
jgi:hypothetical protein